MIRHHWGKCNDHHTCRPAVSWNNISTNSYLSCPQPTFRRWHYVRRISSSSAHSACRQLTHRLVCHKRLCPNFFTTVKANVTKPIKCPHLASSWLFVSFAKRSFNRFYLTRCPGASSLWWCSPLHITLRVSRASCHPRKLLPATLWLCRKALHANLSEIWN